MVRSEYIDLYEIERMGVPCYLLWESIQDVKNCISVRRYNVPTVVSMEDIQFI